MDSAVWDEPQRRERAMIGKIKVLIFKGIILVLLFILGG
jgi:hypothetical protein